MQCTQCFKEVPGETLFGVCPACGPTTIPGVIQSIPVSTYWHDNTIADKATISTAIKKAETVIAQRKPKKSVKKNPVAGQQTTF